MWECLRRKVEIGEAISGEAISSSSLTGSIDRLDVIVKNVENQIDELSKRLAALGVIISRPEIAKNFSEDNILPGDEYLRSPVAGHIDDIIKALHKIKSQIENLTHSLDR